MFGVLFLIVVFVGKIFRGATGGRLMNSMFTQNETSVYIWYVYLILEALWAFVGSASITLAITKRIDSKKR